jgi:hypothetical protein
MQKSETKRPIGVPQTIYNQIERYAAENKKFIFEAVVEAWESFMKSKAIPCKRKSKKR